MSKEQVILLNRAEVDWLYRRVGGACKHAVAVMEAADKDPPTSEAGKLQFSEASQHVDMLRQQTTALEALINSGMNTLGKINARREELEEQLGLIEEPHLKQKIENELSSMPKEEEYRLVMNRHSIKYVLEIVTSSIERIKTKLIPEYEKRPPECFETNALPMSRSFYINKLWRDKLMLEKIMVRLEKRL